MKSIVYLSLLCALVACGGGSADAPAPAPAPIPIASAPPCTPLRQVTLELFGDSTEVGYNGTSAPVAVRTPGILLQEALDARFGRGATLVTVRAVAGTTSQQLRDGTDGVNAPWPQSVTAKIAVINHGVNDLIHGNGETMAAYKANLEFFAANTNGAQVVFETPNVIAGWDVPGTPPTPGTAPYAQTMREVAAEFGDPVADTFAISEVSMLGDQYHPSDSGYVTIVSKSLAPAVMPLVAKLLCIGN